jgi:hypothetical protein
MIRANLGVDRDIYNLVFERYDRLRGYPGDVQEVALALWTEATEAVRDYRAKHP